MDKIKADCVNVFIKNPVRFDIPCDNILSYYLPREEPDLVMIETQDFIYTCYKKHCIQILSSGNWESGII